jgi:hypothetical protein
MVSPDAAADADLSPLWLALASAQESVAAPVPEVPELLLADAEEIAPAVIPCGSHSSCPSSR